MLTDMLMTNTERFKLLQREFRDMAGSFQRASTFEMRQAALRRLWRILEESRSILQEAAKHELHFDHKHMSCEEKNALQRIRKHNN